MQNNKKPSERISEIQRESRVFSNDLQYTEISRESAIIMYLDEEYEKKQPQQDKLLD